MALGHSPKIETNGLVFYYDMLNIQKSWKGAPTTNLITNPFLSNGTDVGNIFISGYETSETIESAPTEEMRAISPYWYKCVKTSATNGRVWFLAMSGLTPSVDYTYSVYVYVNDPNVASFTQGSDNGNNSNTTQVLSSWSASDLGKVKRLAAIFRSVSGGQTQGFRINSNAPIGTTFWLTGFQCELGSVATRVVNGTRTNTQSILDLTGNNIITANSLTYNSDDTYGFNGVDTYASTTSLSLPTNITVSVWAKRTGTVNTYSPLVEQGGSRLFRFILNSTRIGFGNDSDTNSYYVTPTGQSELNTWYNYVATFDGTYHIYVNGVEQSLTQSTNAYGAWGTNQLNFGYRPYTGSVSSFNGLIPVVQIYNRAISATEVKQNFNAQRGRYGI